LWNFIYYLYFRLADHIQTAGRPIVNLFTNLKYWVLDEADRLLGGSFDEQLGTIKSALPVNRQILLFTATVTEDVRSTAGTGKNEVYITIILGINCLPSCAHHYGFIVCMGSNARYISLQQFIYDCKAGNPFRCVLDSPNLDQFYVLCPPDYKDGYLMEILRMIKDEEFTVPIRSMIIFAGTRK